MISPLEQTDLDIYAALQGEQERQRDGVELIPSENYVSSAVLQAMGTVFNNKYSEGYPGKRYYGGQEYTDVIENIARDRATQLFNCEHANVQPHAGAPANIATYFALCEPGDTIMGMDLSHGGHLTHGHPVTHITKVFNFVRYKIGDLETGALDYDHMRQTALKEKPKLILVGYSAYAREVDYEKIKSIADEVGAYTMMDMAHVAGLIVGGVHKNPFDYGFDICTTTTHKTLRGPRGGMILSQTKELGKKIDKAIFPGLQGGPIMQMIAAKAVAFHEAMQPEFKEYAEQIIKSAQAMADHFMQNGAKLVTNGTSNHMLLVDAVASWGTTGQELETLFDRIGITLNKNMVPDDTRSPLDPSGIRFGTPAITTRGMKEEHAVQLADFMLQAIENRENDQAIQKLHNQVIEFSRQFPVPGIAEVKEKATTI